MKKRVAVISIVLENAKEHQGEFNNIISKYQEYIYGRMGIPFHSEGISVVSLTMVATTDEINALTGQIGSIPSLQVKTAISKTEID